MGEEDALNHWNARSPDEAAQDILPCCGSRAWARRMAGHRPIRTSEQLIELAGQVWRELPEVDRQEAFASHPRIGERNAPAHATEQSASWSAEEQRLLQRPTLPSALLRRTSATRRDSAASS